MKHKRFVSEISSCALLAVLTSLLLVREAHAYLDPGSGSFILQVLLASLMGLLFMLKIFWGKIVGFFSKGSAKSEATIQGPDQDMGTPVSSSENVNPSVHRAQLEKDDD